MTNEIKQSAAIIREQRDLLEKCKWAFERIASERYFDQITTLRLTREQMADAANEMLKEIYASQEKADG